MPITDPEARRAYHREWLAKRRAAWFEGKTCVRCGTTDDLQIDHIDPEAKVSHRVWSWSQARQFVELEKCQVLCKGCHKAKTRKDYEPPHGTDSRYVGRKCRCVPCTEAHNTTKNARRAARRMAGLPWNG